MQPQGASGNELPGSDASMEPLMHGCVDPIVRHQHALRIGASSASHAHAHTHARTYAEQARAHLALSIGGGGAGRKARQGMQLVGTPPHRLPSPRLPPNPTGAVCLAWYLVHVLVVVRRLQDHVICYTLGVPRVGNHAFARLYNKVWRRRCAWTCAWTCAPSQERGLQGHCAEITDLHRQRVCVSGCAHAPEATPPPSPPPSLL